MSLLTAQIAKNSHAFAKIYFIFLRKTSQAIRESLSVLILEVSIKIGKLVLKQNQF